MARPFKTGEQVKYSPAYLARIGSQSPELRHATGILADIVEYPVFTVGKVDWLDGSELATVRLDCLIHA